MVHFLPECQLIFYRQSGTLSSGITGTICSGIAGTLYSGISGTLRSGLYSGLVIYHMKLESGSFKLPVFDESTNTFQTSWQDLMMMVRGVTADETVDKKRWKKLSK